MAEDDDASRLVDEAFGAALPRTVESADEAATEPDDAAESDAEPAADATEADAEPNGLADAAESDAEPAQPDDTGDSPAATPERFADSGGDDGADPAVAPDRTGDSPVAAGETSSDAIPPAPARAGSSLRNRVLGAVTVLAIAGAAGVLVLTGSGSSSGSAAAPSTSPATIPPSVNPQAFYSATQDDTPFSTGATSSPLTDDALRAAVPGCGPCKLVTRANGFSADGAALALFRTGDPLVGKPNFKLVVVGADHKLVWAAPDGVQALTSGIERFTVDKAGNYYLALPGARSGYILIALTWRDGKVVDIGDLLHPKVRADAVVGVLPEPTPGATATIVAQTRDGVPDADTGGLIESQYQVRDGVPVLIGCRRHVGESGEWLAFPPVPAKGCVDAPPGPVGPPDGDASSTGH